MNEHVTTKGIILKTSNLGEYDKRLVVLSSDFGKITVFARGVRRQGSRHLAACSPFTFGEFDLFPSRDAYSLVNLRVENYFEALRTDFDISCLGMYFLEVADYYTRENLDERQMLSLLYVSLRMLEKIVAKTSSIDPRLVRCAFEMKAIAVNGEFPGASAVPDLSVGAVNAINHIAATRVEKLFSFNVTPEVLSELEKSAGIFRGRFLNADFKSLSML